jgi:IclR family KDG regulon transcriptional repressor
METNVFYRERPYPEMTKTDFKRVPAICKCFDVLELLANQKKPLGISEISNALQLNKSTVFNIVYTLADLDVLESSDTGFGLGPKFYVLGKSAESGSELIRTIHPYLVEINQETDLSAFLGMRSGGSVIILDKAESAAALKVSSEIGIRIPLLAGAHGQALLSLLSDDEITELLSQHELKRFTRHSCVDKKRYWERIKRVQKEHIAFENETYIEGIRAIAVPLRLKRHDLQTAVWAVGLKTQMKKKVVESCSAILKEIANKIETQWAL